LIFYPKQQKHDHGRCNEHPDPISYHHQCGDAPVLTAGQDDADGHKDANKQGINGIQKGETNGMEHAG